MEITKTLTQLGLNEKEAKIYLACLELGTASILEISKKSDINRATAYYIIDELKKKELIVQTTKKKKKLFIAADPGEIMKIIREKESLLKSIMPDLNALNNISIKKPKIRFYEGDEGMIKVIKDFLTARNGVVAFADTKEFDAALKYDPDIVKKRVKKNIKIKIIFPDTPRAKEWIKTNKQQLRETRYISEKKFPFNTQIYIYDNKVNITSWHEKSGIIIESKQYANTMRLIFNLCWENIK
jgi:HTH-type transcriptional regulator, sugar sensing transcriptional regulator